MISGVVKATNHLKPSLHLEVTLSCEVQYITILRIYVNFSLLASQISCTI